MMVKASARGQTVTIELSDGAKREADYLFLGTGYRANVDKLTFIDGALRKQIRHHDGYPMLNEWFESSLPNLHFVGALAGRTFGPVCHFMSGAKYPARQIVQHAAKTVQPVGCAAGIELPGRASLRRPGPRRSARAAKD
jgi:pyruvate/2-oxoglutarate dehydrogenase complex dihydrolipoamide dehydrogenase (E3) component